MEFVIEHPINATSWEEVRPRLQQALRDQDADGRSFVLVLGMSGGGKSSVVRAGVLPMLTKPGVIEGVDVWRRTAYRPTDVRGDLFTGLAKALLRECALPSLDEDNEGPEELAQVMRESPRARTPALISAPAISREPTVAFVTPVTAMPRRASSSTSVRALW